MSLDRYRALEADFAKTKRVIAELEGRLKAIDSKAPVEFGGEVDKLLTRKAVELVLEEQRARLTRLEKELAEAKRELENSLPEREARWRKKVLKHKELLDEITRNVKTLHPLLIEILNHEQSIRENDENYYDVCRIFGREPSIPRPTYFESVLADLKSECERFLRALGEKINVV